jgi:O-antigen/teichoic acid export membrane protein
MGSSKLLKIMRAKIHSDFLSKLISVFSTKVLLLVVGMAASILSARLLGPEGRGVFGVAIAVCGIGVQFGNLGVHSANTYYLAKDNARLPVTIGNSLALTGVVGITSMFVYLFFIIFPQFAPVNGIALFLALILIPFQLYLMLQQNLFIALGKISQYNSLEIMSGTFYPILFVILALFGVVTPQSALAASLIGCALVVTIGFIWIKSLINDKISLSVLYFKQNLPFGLKTYIACLFSYLVLRADILMLNYFLGNAQTGLYSIAVSLADMVSILATTTGMLLFPTAAAISSDLERYKFIKRVITYLFLAMLLMIIIAVLISKYAILLLYGLEYAPSIKVFNILMPGILCLSISSLLSNYFASKNMLIINMITPIIALVINILANLILIPRYGINGAAIASSISYFLMFCIMFITFKLDGNKVRLRGKK